MRILAQFNRHQIETFTEVAIALLDLQDGDADLEIEPDDEDDDPAGQCDEDGNNTGWSPQAGPGCNISDAAECEEGRGE
jgi:hypothetical protein